MTLELRRIYSELLTENQIPGTRFSVGAGLTRSYWPVAYITLADCGQTAAALVQPLYKTGTIDRIYSYYKLNKIKVHVA